MTRSARTQVVAVTLVAAVLAAAALLPRGDGAAVAAPEGTPGQRALPRVSVRSPERRTIRRVARLVADVLPRADVSVSARANGYVRRLAVDVGSRVAAGDTIAELDAPDLDAAVLVAEAGVAKAVSAVLEAQGAELAARAGRAESEAVVGQAEADVERARAEAAMRTVVRDRLEAAAKTSPNLVAQDALDDALAQAAIAAAKERQTEAAVRVAKARVEAAEARSTAAKAAVTTAMASETVARSMAAQARTAAGFATITAPFAGVVMDRFIDAGALVRSGSAATGTPLVRLIDASVLRVRFHVAEPDAPFATQGRTFHLSVDELPGRKFDGTVARTADALEPGTRTMTVEGDLPNADGALRPGMMGRVTLDLEEHANALVVPAGAVTTVKRRSSVLVVAGGKVAKRAVRIGADDGIVIEVLDGLADADTVIVAGGSLVAEGDAVEPVAEKAQ